MEKRFNPERAHMLNSEGRQQLLKRDKLIEYLDVQADDVIADLGAGTGFLTLPAAKQTKEKVYALDIEPKMLALLKQHAKEEQIANIEYVESDLDDILLTDESVNKVIISHVLHEVPDLDRTLAEVKRILQADGKLFVVEWEKIDSGTDGPPQEIRIPSFDMADQLQALGYKTEIISVPPANYVVKAVLTTKGR